LPPVLGGGTPVGVEFDPAQVVFGFPVVFVDEVVHVGDPLACAADAGVGGCRVGEQHEGVSVAEFGVVLDVGARE
jgi:hypothetical protein